MDKLVPLWGIVLVLGGAGPQSKDCTIISKGRGYGRDPRAHSPQGDG